MTASYDPRTWAIMDLVGRPRVMPRLESPAPRPQVLGPALRADDLPTSAPAVLAWLSWNTWDYFVLADTGSEPVWYETCDEPMSWSSREVADMVTGRAEAWRILR